MCALNNSPIHAAELFAGKVGSKRGPMSKLQLLINLKNATNYFSSRQASEHQGLQALTYKKINHADSSCISELV